jgi:hypothetical protein
MGHLQRRRLAAASVLPLALAVLPLRSASAAPTYGTQTVTLPVTAKATGARKIDVAFKEGSGFAQPSLFVLDTGSTGITVSSDVWHAESSGAAKLGSGSVTYTSSGRVLIGDWYQATLQLGDGPKTAESSVPVLQVTSIQCLTSQRDCQPTAHPMKVSFFGIGFGREATSQSTTPGGTVAAIPAYNPLLNITKVNGTPVSASTPQQPGSTGVVGDFGSGYILSSEGLTLGLTAANTAPFPTLDLTWNDRTTASGFNSGYADWNPVPGTLTVNGSSGTGTVLTDSGVDSMLLTPAPGTVVNTDGACKTGRDCLAPGSTVSVAIGTIVSYSFGIGPDAGAPLQPAPLAAPLYAVKDIGSEVFVNTSVSFFDEYAYLYDYVNGQVGYLAMASAPGPLPLVGVGAAWAWSRRLRRRIAPGGSD